MSTEEVASFLAEERTVTCATVGPRGWPHLMPLWYVLRDSESGSDVDGGPSPRVWAWTYASSQKVRNLERDPRVTLTVQNMENPYEYVEIRGTVAERTHEGADEHIDAMAKKYMDKDEYPMRQPGEQRVIIRVEPDYVRVWGR